MTIKSKDVKSKPAGKDDNFQFVAIDINNIIENDKFVLKANGSVKRSDLSTELEQGMSIKAYDGGRETVEER